MPRLLFARLLLLLRRAPGGIALAPGAADAERVLDMHAVQRVERARGVDFHEWCLDLAGPEGVTRMGAFDRSEMQTWLGVLRVASQPPAPAMGAGSTLAADGGDGGAEAENLGTGVGTD